jgi:hypothetical protein
VSGSKISSSAEAALRTRNGQSVTMWQKNHILNNAARVATPGRLSKFSHCLRYRPGAHH